MNLSKKVFLGTTLIAGLMVFAISWSPPGPVAPPEKDVIVVNTAAQPVPVTGNVVVSGTTTIEGTIAATQSGAWSVGINPGQSVGINPAQNDVDVALQPSFYFDSGFAVINDGDQLDLGPFDLTNRQAARIVVFAVNSDINTQVRVDTPTADFPFENFTVPGEDGATSRTFSYDAPPQSLIVRLTESGPGGSNYQVLVIAR